MELLKTRMQVQTEVCKTGVQSLSTAAHSSSTVAASATYSSPLDCFKKIITTEGTQGLFRGQAITLMRDVSIYYTMPNAQFLKKKNHKFPFKLPCLAFVYLIILFCMF